MALDYGTADMPRSDAAAPPEEMPEEMKVMPTRCCSAELAKATRGKRTATHQRAAPAPTRGIS